MKFPHLCLFAFLCVLLSVFSSCKYSTEYQTINANNQFSVSIPPWLKEDKSLKEGSVFQYANHFRNFYVVGETISKADLKRTTAELMNDNLNVLRKALAKAVVTDSTTVKGANLQGTRVEIYGKMSNENIYFSEVIFEGTKNVYHLSVWTRSETRKLRFKEDIDKIIASFKEI